MGAASVPSSHQRAVDRPVGCRQELDDRTRRWSQAGAAGDGHSAGHIDQVGVPVVFASHRARDLHAVGGVVGRRVAAEARLGLGRHLDRVGAVAREDVVADRRRGRAGQVDAAQAVALEGVVLHQRVGLVGQVQAVAGVEADLAVGDARRGAVDGDRVVVGRAAVAHHDVVQHVDRVVAAVGVADPQPVAGRGPVGAFHAAGLSLLGQFVDSLLEIRAGRRQVSPAVCLPSSGARPSTCRLNTSAPKASSRTEVKAMRA